MDTLTSLLRISCLIAAVRLDTAGKAPEHVARIIATDEEVRKLSWDNPRERLLIRGTWRRLQAETEGVLREHGLIT